MNSKASKEELVIRERSLLDAMQKVIPNKFYPLIENLKKD